MLRDTFDDRNLWLSATAVPDHQLKTEGHHSDHAWCLAQNFT